MFAEHFANFTEHKFGGGGSGRSDLFLRLFYAPRKFYKKIKPLITLNSM